MVVPGVILLCACIMVSTATVSPEFTTSLGGSSGSSQPHWVVSSVAGSAWILAAGHREGAVPLALLDRLRGGIEPQRENDGGEERSRQRATGDCEVGPW